MFEDDSDDLLGGPIRERVSGPPDALPASPQALPAQIGEAALSALLGVTSSRLRTLVRDGTIVRAGRGQFDFSQSLTRYIARLRESAERAGRPSAGGDELKAEKLRLTRAQADAQETRVARERGELVQADAVTREWASLLRDLRNALLAVPSRCGASLGHLTATDIATIDREIRTALEGVAHGD